MRLHDFGSDARKFLEKPCHDKAAQPGTRRRPEGAEKKLLS